MASLRALFIFSVAVTLFLLISDGARAEGKGAAGAPSTPLSEECMSALLSLSGCLPYVQEGSTVAKPDAATCCAPLKKVVKEKVGCLCEAFNSGSSSSFGVTLNTTKALSLPSACSLKTPPVSKCKLGVAGSPLGVPVHAPGASPALAPSSSGLTLSITPTPSPATSAAMLPSVPSRFLIQFTLVFAMCSFLVL